MGTPTTVDADNIVAAITDYTMGFMAADGERMKRALHPQFAMHCPAFIISYPDSDRNSIIREGKLYEWTTSDMIYKSANGDFKMPEDRRHFDVKVLDVYGNIATARLQVVDEQTEYMLLAKFDGQWKIVNVVWDK